MTEEPNLPVMSVTGQAAAAEGPPLTGSAAATVHHLPRRRTYLDACREQGVFQKDEETRAEIFDTRSEIAAKRTQVRQKREGLHGPIAIATVEGKPMPVDPMDRVRAACAAYRERRPDDPTFKLFEHLLCQSDLSAADIAGCLDASRRDVERAADESLSTDVEAFENRRLNGEGLNVRSYPPTTEPAP